MAQLTCQALSVGYEGRAVLEGLNMSIHAGDYLCIVGENGSGKSTLMKTLLGLLPPIHGEILMGDGLNHNEIGYLPQQTALQKDFPASVREIVLSGWQSGVIAPYPADRSSESCWLGRCVRHKRCCCWTSLSPVWTQKSQQSYTH